MSWTHSGLNVEHYDVRMSASDVWVNVGKALIKPLSLLPAGAYGAQVRACAVGNVCSAPSAAVPFTVAAQATTPPAVPSNVIIEKIPLSPPPTPAGNLLFSSSWENAALGCGAGLLDGVWADYGGSGACDGTVHDADIVSGIAKLGTKSLRVTQKPGGINGTDFRIVSRSFGAQAELTAIFWVRYDPNYHWASADHKIVLLMGGDSQNIYINYRGGSDATHPRLCAYPLANDTFFCQTAGPYVTVNSWFRIRVHVIAGVHGRVELFLQPDGQAETALPLTRDAGTGATVPTDINTGTIDGIKLDTTYNSGTSVTSNMFQYYDGVSVFSGLVQ